MLWFYFRTVSLHTVPPPWLTPLSSLRSVTAHLVKFTSPPLIPLGISDSDIILIDRLALIDLHRDFCDWRLILQNSDLRALDFLPLV